MAIIIHIQCFCLALFENIIYINKMEHIQLKLTKFATCFALPPIWIVLHRTC